MPCCFCGWQARKQPIHWSDQQRQSNTMQEARKTFMYRMQPQQCSLVLALLLCCCCQHVTSHALMVYPASRNWLAYLEQNYYWSHGLSAGGGFECLRDPSLCKSRTEDRRQYACTQLYLQTTATAIAGMRCVSAAHYRGSNACARSSYEFIVTKAGMQTPTALLCTSFLLL